MAEVKILIESEEMAYALACIFAGISLRENAMQKSAERNFVRMYKLLSDEKKRIVREDIEIVKSQPGIVIDNAIRLFEKLKDENNLE
jgi:hypothetical protein